LLKYGSNRIPKRVYEFDEEFQKVAICERMHWTGEQYDNQDAMFINNLVLYLSILNKLESKEDGEL